MSRVLIVGSEGQIGTQLSKALSNRDDFDYLFLCDIKDKSRTDLNYFKVDALSYDDLKSLILACMNSTNVQHSVIFGVSNNDSLLVDDKYAKHIGYKPKDNAEDHRKN